MKFTYSQTIEHENLTDINKIVKLYSASDCFSLLSLHTINNFHHACHIFV